jgi:putative flippase GtrA
MGVPNFLREGFSVISGSAVDRVQCGITGNVMDTKQEIVRFFIAGVIVVTVDIGIYYVLVQFLPFSVSKAISFVIAGIIGYWLNKYWIFKRKRSSYKEVGRFWIINLLALGINVFTNQWILNVWHGAVGPALMTATAVTASLTFISFKWWVFKNVST